MVQYIYTYIYIYMLDLKLVITHYNDVMMAMVASQITSLTIVYSIVYSDTDQRKHLSSMSLAFEWGIHQWPVNSPHKWPVTWIMFPFDDVIICICWRPSISRHSLTTKLSIFSQDYLLSTWLHTTCCWLHGAMHNVRLYLGKYQCI